MSSEHDDDARDSDDRSSPFVLSRCSRFREPVKASEFPDTREFRASCCRCSTSMYVDTRTITIKFHDNERVTLRRSEREATKSESERKREGEDGRRSD